MIKDGEDITSIGNDKLKKNYARLFKKGNPWGSFFKYSPLSEFTLHYCPRED